MNSIEGIIDLHIHTAPDVRPRRFTDLELARLARDQKALGVTLKSHHSITVERARQAEEATPGLRVMGGIVLNEAVGGLNPAAVAAACSAGARIVWLPTLDAANHRRREGRPGGIAVTDGHRVVPALGEILRIIAESKVALATGHISPEDIRCVAATAADLGIRRIIVNHPEHRVVGLTIEAQAELSRIAPVYFERCFAQPVGGGRYASNLAVNRMAIEALGPESTVLATDSGQLETAPWDQAWREIIADLENHGFAAPEIRLMTQDNPAFLCGMTESAPRSSRSESTPR